ncbi:MAG: hypothetical protein SFU98_08950 [Leptospiraceae bacterium]|nr:hypothetical protein [Leptospiraceae bacterium]
MRVALSFLLTVFFAVPIFSNHGNPDLAKKTFEAFYNKDFPKSRNLAFQYLKDSESIDTSDKVLKIFFITEPDLNHLDLILDRIYISNQKKNFHFYKLVYILLEKSTVAENHKIATKWGEIFVNEAKNSKRYSRGLYLYSLTLFQRNESQRAETVLLNCKSTEIVMFSPKLELNRILSLTDEKVKIKQYRRYLRNNYKANYSDFVLASLIQSYKKVGKVNKATNLKRKFERDFASSIFLEKVRNL